MAALPPGLVLVPGAEISCADLVDGQRRGVHLLGYLFDPANGELADALGGLRRDRERRARIMVDKLRALGVPICWEQVVAAAAGAPVGRPHLAQQLADSGAVPSYADAFSSDWLGTGGRAYEPKHALDPVRAVELVTAAGGVSVLAHPAGREPVSDATIAAMAAAGLAGLEVDHVEHDPGQRHRLRGLADDLGLLATGSSDFHGARKPHDLGVETTDPQAYAALVERASGARPVVI